MATATIPTVVFSRAQREICCELLYEEIRDGLSRDDAGRLRLMMAGARLFEALDWRNDDPGRDGWTFEVDGEIAWLVEDFFGPFVEEYARPWLEENPEPEELPGSWVDTAEARAEWAEWHARQGRQYRAVIAATEAITEAVA
jgi:hypothetical protein